MSSPEIWVYDIETTPNLVYTWGLWQQNVGINQIVESQDVLCFAAHKIGSRGIEAHAAWDDYPAMIRRLHEIMTTADYLVGYNNQSYDDKIVKGAFAKLSLPPPAPYRAIDLLRVVKKSFKYPSHKLDYVCRALGLDVKVNNGGMETWIQCLNGDEAAQRKMLRYNKNDTKITTQLFMRLLPWIDGLNLPLHSEDGEGGEMHCTRCNSTEIQSRGWAYTTTFRYRRYQCQGCLGWLRDKKCEPVFNTELRSV